MRNAIRSLVGATESNNDASESVTEVDHHELAKENLDEFSDTAARMYYCGLCHQVFSTFDLFYNHRMATESGIARRRDDGFTDYQKLMPGDEFPAEATVGTIQPCEPLTLPDK